jgi:hypothetical protein
MINANVKIFNEEYDHSLEVSINKFLKTIDVRQIIKTEYSSSISSGQYSTIRSHSAVIYYVNIEDIRDAKIDSVLEIK